MNDFQFVPQPILVRGINGRRAVDMGVSHNAGRSTRHQLKLAPDRLASRRPTCELQTVATKAYVLYAYLNIIRITCNESKAQAHLLDEISQFEMENCTKINKQ